MGAMLLIVLWWCVSAAYAHDTMGHFTDHGSGNPALKYLHGKKIGTDAPGAWASKPGDIINCCTFGGSGDCVEIQASDIETVDGGYLFGDGEFVAEGDATLSPDGRLYRCKNAGKPSHCIFVRKGGV